MHSPILRVPSALCALLVFVLAAACRGDSGPTEPTRSPLPPASTATATTSPVAATPSVTSEPAITPVATPAATPGPSVVSYVVQPGDTLSAIARRFGTTVRAIVEANALPDANQIVAGQTLRIPAPGSPPATVTPPPSGSARVVRRGDPTRRAVTLTFDAGSDAGFTGQILDALRANGITAAFGVTGRWAEQNPALLRRIVSDGHELVNHSYDHASFTGRSTDRAPLTREQRWQQLDRTEAIAQSLAGATTKPYFRPPYGDYDESVNADVFARGYSYNVMWTVDSQGWNGLPASEIVARCLRLAEAGAIYVFHVGSASQDAAALPAIIDGLRDEGYAFSPLASLLGE